MKKLFFVLGLQFIFLTSYANLDDMYPIDPEPMPICHINQNENQIATVQNYLNQINETVECGSLDKAKRLSVELTRYLSQSADPTPMGHCYEDSQCKHLIVNQLTTKNMCKASGGKSWDGTGACTLVK